MTLSENRSLWLTNIVNTNEEEINKLVAIADRTDLTAIKNTNLPGIYKDGYLSGIPIPVLDKEAINKRSETIHNKIQKRAEKKAEIKLTGPCINSLAAFLNENDVPFKAIVPTSIFYSMVNACPNFFRFEKFVNDSIVVVAERFNKWVMESYSTEAKKVLALLASTNNCLEKFKNDFTFFELGFDDFAERLSKGYSIRKHDIYNAPESTIKEAFTKFSRCFEIGHSTWREIGGIDRFIKTFFPPMITNPKDLHAILHNCRSVTSAEFDLRHTTKGDTSIAYLQMRLILPKTSDTDKEILRKIHEKLNNYDNKGLKKGNPDTLKNFIFAVKGYQLYQKRINTR